MIQVVVVAPRAVGHLTSEDETTILLSLLIDGNIVVSQRLPNSSGREAQDSQEEADCSVA